MDLDNEELEATKKLHSREGKKVGDYVRTRDGIIAKVLEIKNQDDDVLNYYCLDNYIGVLERSIVKNSSNIIDLIEVGDIVKDKDNYCLEVSFVRNNEIYCNDYNLDDSVVVLNIKDLKSIVTKEQFARIEYKVEE